MRVKVLIEWNAQSVVEVEIPDGTSPDYVKAAVQEVLDAGELPEVVNNPTIELVCAKEAHVLGAGGKTDYEDGIELAC